MRDYLLPSLTVLLLAMGSPVLAEEAKSEPPAKQEQPLKEDYVETKHTVKINGIAVPYKAVAGNLVLKDAQGKDKASIFYVSYTKEGEDANKRPITFVFNGGPGSSSLWLHIGAFGPKRLVFNEDGSIAPPYSLVDNEFSILDLTDLVFIDPVSTGYSRAAPGVEAKQFHGLDEDIETMADFIRLYTTRTNRWLSPKYLAGESYGTTRAVGLASYLHDYTKMFINGMLLLSSVLNFQTISDPQGGNDLPYITAIPTYAATAWYHKKLAPELQQDFSKTLKEAEAFALTDYAAALVKGDKLDRAQRKEIIGKMARLTGLKPDYIDLSNLRVDMSRFSKELLRQEKRTVGRFDSRYAGIEGDILAENPEYDPSANAFMGRFTGAFNDYVRSGLHWKEDKEYEILAAVHPWNYGKNQNAYLSYGDKLRDVINKMPGLKVFVASGYYDLATPYFSTDYTMDHLFLNPSFRSSLTLTYYDAGHMFYVHYPSLEKLKKDITAFFQAPALQLKSAVSR